MHLTSHRAFRPASHPASHRLSIRPPHRNLLLILLTAAALIAACSRNPAPTQPAQPPAAPAPEIAATPALAGAATLSPTAGSLNPVATSPVATSDVAYIRARETVNLRSGPGTDHPILGEVAAGQTALVTGVSPDRAWWRVICPDDTTGECYVTADPTLTEPAQPPGAPAPAVETDVQYVILNADTPIYDSPLPDHNVIGAVFGGQTARVTGKSPDGAWWRVLCPDDSVGECYIVADPALAVPATP